MSHDEDFRFYVIATIFALIFIILAGVVVLWTG